MFDGIQDLLLVVDARDRLTHWNVAVERTLSRGDLAGVEFPSLVVAEDAESVREMTETARWIGRGTTVADIRTGDGRRIPHEFRCERVTADGVDDGAVMVVGRDVTDRERRRERLAVLTRVLRHDARNRLATIRGYLTEAREALDADGADREAVDPGAAAEHLATVETAAGALTDAIDRLYAVQRHVADADPEPVRVDVVLDRVVTALGDDQPGATVETRVDPPTLRAATGPALGVALEELVTNALRHGGDEPRVEVEATAADETVRIEVRDDGPGIPSTELEAIRAGEVTPLGHVSGTGLWVVRWAVRSFGGGVEFDVDGGTTVTVIAPRVRDDRNGQGDRDDPDDPNVR